MTRVTQFAQQQRTLANVLSAQARLQEAQIQISSGKSSLSYAGIAKDTRRLVSLETTQSRATQFIQNNKIYETRLEIMDSAISSIFDATSDLRTTLIQALSDSSSGSVPLAQIAGNLLEVVGGLLNTKDNGRYLFAGSKTNTAAVDITKPNFTVTTQEAVAGPTNLFGRGMSVTVDGGDISVSNNSAYRLSYDTVGGTAEKLTLTNLTSGVSQTIDVKTVVDAVVTAAGRAAGSDLKTGETIDIEFSSLGTTVRLFGDDTANSGFTRATDVITSGTLSATLLNADITINTSANIVFDNDGGVTNGALTDLLNSSAYNKTTGLLTINFNTANASVTLDKGTNGLEFSIDNAKFEAKPTFNLDTGGAHNIRIRMAGDNSTSSNIIGVLTLTDINGVVSTGSAGFTIPIGNMMFGADVVEGGDGYYLGDKTELTARVDDTTTISYGITADRQAFQDVVAALKFAIDGANQNDTSKLEKALGRTQAAIQSLAGFRTEIGSDLDTLVRATQSNNDLLLFVEGVISDIENVDIAAVVAQMAGDQLILQASFMTLARISSLSLVDFMR